MSQSGTYRTLDEQLAARLARIRELEAENRSLQVQNMTMKEVLTFTDHDIDRLRCLAVRIAALFGDDDAERD